MKSVVDNTTIAAIATPYGTGGVGIVRISGPQVKQIAARITQKRLKPRKAELATFVNAMGNVVDMGLAILFPAPNSFTGEDVLELQGHGGVVVLAMLLDAAFSWGAVLAQPGEFSARAFANDKLDLAQAEAIADLIAAQSKQAASAALRSLQGKFSTQVNALVAALTTLRIKVEAAIDFPEDADYLGKDQLPLEIKQQVDICQQLLAEAEHGQLLAVGVKVVVLGEPNVGKSSLLNLLSGEDTAIVTDIPGTTRDILQAQICLQGIRMDVLDTAGIRQSTDCIEQEGIKRAWQAVATAQIIILMVDASVTSETDPYILYPEWMERLSADAKVLVVSNKIDKVQQSPVAGEISAYIPKEFQVAAKCSAQMSSGAYPQYVSSESSRQHSSRLKGERYSVVKMSAKTGFGKQQLEAELSLLAGVDIHAEPAFIARKRHVSALQAAVVNLQKAVEWLVAGGVLELVAEELRLAQQELAAITGEFTADDLLGKIFSEFCIGK